MLQEGTDGQRSRETLPKGKRQRAILPAAPASPRAPQMDRPHCSQQPQDKGRDREGLCSGNSHRSDPREEDHS